MEDLTINKVESPTGLLSKMKVGEVEYAPNVQRPSFDKIKTRVVDKYDMDFSFNRVKKTKYFSIVRLK